jgi:serine O-acetyltransferase
MGRAKYGNGFSFSQNCTVGNNNGVYPIIGENVKMCMSSAILGKCNIENNVIIGAGAIVKDQDVHNNSIEFNNKA